VYCAPEVFLQQTYSYEIDLWSVGVMFYELVTGRKPFKDSEDILVIMQSVLADVVVFQSRDCVDLYVAAFVFQALQKDPKDRLSLVEMMAHPCFNI